VTRKNHIGRFLRRLPAAATDERNLIRDELMFHSFTTNLDRLRPNEPVLAESGDVNGRQRKIHESPVRAHTAPDPSKV
jgi:hypothetical protein